MEIKITVDKNDEDIDAIFTQGDYNSFNWVEMRIGKDSIAFHTEDLFRVAEFFVRIKRKEDKASNEYGEREARLLKIQKS